MAESVEARQQPGAPTAGPDLSEALSWVGSRLDETGGVSVGKIEAAFVDTDTERPEWLVVRLGRFGRYGLVPAREAVGGAGHVWVPYGQDAIKGAPKIDRSAPLSRERELELLTHYGIAGEIGRAAELTEREPDAITARPAD